jgi:hypothetical protein
MSAIVQKRKESLPRNSRGTDQVQDYIGADVIIPRDNQRPRHSRLFHLDMASLLSRGVVSELLKNTQ